MLVGVPRETRPGERRVALIPDALGALSRAGVEVCVERGAGAAAGFRDGDYERAGARIVDRDTVLGASSALLQVETWSANPEAPADDLDALRPGQLVVGFADPLGAPERVATMAERGLSVLALELVPRISRAQAMDALSSMALIAGYKSALMAADRLPRCMPLFMTAAGTLKPARALVIGAGVAGLQAIATARRLGALVTAYDVRPEVAEQVASVGGEFLELDLEAEAATDEGGYARSQSDDFYQKQRELLGDVVADSDIVITTAAIPGRQAPLLVTADAVRRMRPGSVIVDLAAARGGNCELSRPDEEVNENGVTVLGPTDAPSLLPEHASQLYSANLTKFFTHLLADGDVRLDTDDPIVAETLLCRDGSLVHPRLAPAEPGKEVA